MLGHSPLLTCSAWPASNLLDRGDKAVLVAPVARFTAELERMNLVNSRFAARPLEEGQSYVSQAIQTEAGDLQAALKKAQVPKDEAARIYAAHAKAREKLRKFLKASGSWRASSDSSQEDNKPAGASDAQSGTIFHTVEKGQTLATIAQVYGVAVDHVLEANPDTEAEKLEVGSAVLVPAPKPKFPDIQIPAGLPEEFADYLEGALVWHNPQKTDKSAARAAWTRLLERPAEERRYKSTWAAFMLGKMLEKEEPKRAIEYFQQVRDLARHSFVDSAGLAVASLGLEARIRLAENQFEQAIELYLEQMAAGDDSAAESLRITAGSALNDSEALPGLARNPRTQRVITAYFISLQPPTEQELNDEHNSRSQEAVSWLEAVEAAGVKDVESAEKLALAAYQNSQMDLAARWIRRAPGSPVAQWLQAKLLLRAGKVSEAAALLSRVSRSFPVEPPSTNQIIPANFKDNLYISRWNDDLEASRQVLGELGALRLARHEYTQALDALLNAGFWMDAAYVAERVLTLDELKNYVDQHWLAVLPLPLRGGEGRGEGEGAGSQDINTSATTIHDEEQLLTSVGQRQQIRYLLARRLTRELRGHEARPYYPPEWLTQFDALVQALQTGWDESLPSEQRAPALFQAAIITRTNGMELIGTELEPDWRVDLGNSEGVLTYSNRASIQNAQVLIATEDELSRAARNGPDPEKRYHYRYQAAGLAWEAAKLMPNNSDQTAFVLWTAGTWLKDRDPDAADLFYKSLVRRNRKTTLGQAADQRRWFPELDEKGNVIPGETAPTPPAEKEDQDGTVTGDDGAKQ